MAKTGETEERVDTLPPSRQTTNRTERNETFGHSALDFTYIAFILSVFRPSTVVVSCIVFCPLSQVTAKRIVLLLDSAHVYFRLEAASCLQISCCTVLTSDTASSRRVFSASERPRRAFKALRSLTNFSARARCSCKSCNSSA